MIFKRYDDYCFQAFLEVAIFYANALSTHEYQALSLSIGRKEAVIYTQWLQLLTKLPPTAHAIILTKGNCEIWQAALSTNELLAPRCWLGTILDYTPTLLTVKQKHQLFENYVSCMEVAR